MKPRFLPLATTVSAALLTGPFRRGSAYQIKLRSTNYYSNFHSQTRPKLAILASLFAIHSGGFISSAQIQDTNCSSRSTARNLSVSCEMIVDEEYPGTAVQRMENVHKRVKQLVDEHRLIDRPWEDIRRELLWAGGLKDLPNAIPGQGYTGHAFNDYNHVDLTTMNDDNAFNENDGSVKQIAVGNRLGSGIQVASIAELGPGGSWSTCANNCHLDPPQDVAHIQFRSRIAFKLVWVPEDYTSFVLVDDHGNMLAEGKPSEGPLPDIRQRTMNYNLVRGSKYAKAADSIAKGVAAE